MSFRHSKRVLKIEVSERRLAEKKLTEYENRLREIIHCFGTRVRKVTVARRHPAENESYWAFFDRSETTQWRMS